MKAFAGGFMISQFAAASEPRRDWVSAERSIVCRTKRAGNHWHALPESGKGIIAGIRALTGVAM